MVYKSLTRLVRPNFSHRQTTNKPRRLPVMLVLMLIALLAPSLQPLLVQAADGDLDPSFGGDGKVTTDFLRGGSDQANAVAVQKDGKIVVAGGNSGNFAVARYNPDGSLDATFGAGGRVVTAFENNPSSVHALALQADGKIIAAGFAENNDTGFDFALARYNGDGSLDASFDGDGMVTTHLSVMSDGGDGASAVALQADGKIVAAGSAQNQGTSGDFALARYNPDGSLDATFDGDGKVMTDFSGRSEGISGVAIQPDGRIVAVGSTSSLSTNAALARYNSDGSLDASFGAGGRVVTDFGGSSNQARTVTLQADGKVVAAGIVFGATFDFVVARYNPNGSLDTSFGGDGIVTTDAGGDFDGVRALALQPDGKIVAAGGNGIFFLLARYNPNGSLDTTFGFGGILATGFGNLSDAFGVAIQPDDGKIVAVGVTNTIILGPNFALARYNPDGSLDTSFDGDGKVTTDWPGGDDLGNAIAIQTDGKIIVAGSNAGDFALARYNPDGSLDTSFGNGGRVLTDFIGGADRAQAVALQADGKIIAAGFANPTNTFRRDFALARYNPDGSLDASFGASGKVITGFVGGDDEARAVALQADGKIVAAGSANFFGFGFALARYNPDGSLDASFDGDGKVITSLSFSGDEAYGIVIQPGDGKIVAAGDAATDGSGVDFALARYNSDGSLDTTFDGDGMVFTDFMGGLDRGRAIGLQADGKIVAAGFAIATDILSRSDFALARYNPDGSLDATFDGDGKVTTNISDGKNNDQALGVAIQPRDGKIVAAGSALNGDEAFSPSDFALARYNPDGSLDPSFGEDGTITTNIGNFSDASEHANAVAIQPTDSKIVAVGSTFNVGTGVDFALARYGDTDSTPPTIACPAGRQAVTARPRAACATVAYPPPVVSDSLPGVTVACAPPSGSCFPVGTTTVTCTATDAAGNTAACSFTVAVFDVLLQSDSAPNTELLINSFTGDYVFCCLGLPSGQSPLRGRGQAFYSGSTITLTHNAQGFRVLATVSPGAGKGTATLKAASGQVLCPIQDRNIFNNLPLLCGNALP